MTVTILTTGDFFFPSGAQAPQSSSRPRWRLPSVRSGPPP